MERHYQGTTLRVTAIQSPTTVSPQLSTEPWGYADTIIGELPIYYAQLGEYRFFTVYINNEYIVAASEIELVHILNPNCIYSLKTQTNVSNVQEYTGKWE